ncbi:hypothetical protein Baya_5696 [Bagarius yarrelli]|uniref:Uncharacterized protein n=1 Tax=Bagarius yarrelli TaxID=175774 RepID=A0A556TY99_BAGYA|nr:hypothetical protein Baya_5696 [Bagarius yarrelli]
MLRFSKLYSFAQEEPYLCEVPESYEKNVFIGHTLELEMVQDLKAQLLRSCRAYLFTLDSFIIEQIPGQGFSQQGSPELSGMLEWDLLQGRPHTTAQKGGDLFQPRSILWTDMELVFTSLRLYAREARLLYIQQRCRHLDSSAIRLPCSHVLMH